MKPTPCYDELLRQYNAGERIQSSTIGGALVEIEELRLSYDSVTARIAILEAVLGTARDTLASIQAFFCGDSYYASALRGRVDFTVALVASIFREHEDIVLKQTVEKPEADNDRLTAERDALRDENFVLRQALNSIRDIADFESGRKHNPRKVIVELRDIAGESIAALRRARGEEREE